MLCIIIYTFYIILQYHFAYLFTKDLLVFSNLNAKLKHWKLSNILLRYLLVTGRSLFLLLLYPQQDCTVSQEPCYLAKKAGPARIYKVR
jgi:hypothetical protein